MKDFFFSGYTLEEIEEDLVCFVWSCYNIQFFNS